MFCTIACGPCAPPALSRPRSRTLAGDLAGADFLDFPRLPDNPGARPSVKGRLGKPVEFGYKAQITDNDGGIVLDYDAHAGNPPEVELLAPAIERAARRVGKVPTAVIADRGYGEACVEDELTELGVAKVVIPRKGKPSAAGRDVERQRPFRRLVKWRTGAEGRISVLKRGCGMDRTRIDGIDGAQTWVGHGVLAHNLVPLAATTWDPEPGTHPGTPAEAPAARCWARPPVTARRVLQVEVAS